MLQTKAAVKHKDEKSFRIEPITIDALQPHEVLTEIKAVGICHTDLVFASGTMPFPFPAVFGHEGAGVVAAVGSEVNHVAPGDKVALSFSSCGNCNSCDAAEPAYCHHWPQNNLTGRRADGSAPLSNDSGALGSAFFGQSSFAHHALSPSRSVIKMEPEIPFELAAPLGCGVQTGIGAVWRSLNVPDNASLIVFGGGAVGLSAVIGAAYRGVSKIVLVEPNAARRTLARELGAHQALDPKADDFKNALKEALPGGANYALETTGNSAVQSTAVKTLSMKGTLGLLGLSSPETALPGEINSMIASGITITGIMEGDSNPESFIPELVDLVAQGKLPIEKLITTYAFDDINLAVADISAQKSIKAVLVL